MLTEEQVKQAFVEYLVNIQGCSTEDATFAATDFPDPHDKCYVVEEFEGRDTINEKSCEIRRCHTDFSMMYTFNNNRPFKYFKYIFIEPGSHTVGEYKAAPKLYRLVSAKKSRS